MDLYEILEVSVSATKEKILFTFGKKISSRYEFGLSPNSPLGHQITIAGAGESPAKKPPGNLRVILVSIITPIIIFL